MTRLRTVAPEMLDKLKQATADEQREAACIACEAAVSHAGVQHPVVAEALATLRRGAPLEEAQRAELQSLAADLDRQYFELQESEEVGHNEERQDVLKYFSRARAVASLLAAFDVDPFVASAESIYEAAAAFDDPSELFAALDCLQVR